MAFRGPKDIPAHRVKDFQKAYRKMTNARPMASDTVKVKNDVPNVLSRRGDSFEVNPWLHANAQSPNRGNKIVPTAEGGSRVVSAPWARAVGYSQLGLTGLNDITGQLQEMMGASFEQIRELTNAGLASLSTVTTDEDNPRRPFTQLAPDGTVTVFNPDGTVNTGERWEAPQPQERNGNQYRAGGSERSGSLTGVGAWTRQTGGRR